MSHNENAESKVLLAIIEKQQNTIAVLSKNTEEMQMTIKDLQVTIANMEETIAELTRKLFGASSERARKSLADDQAEQEQLQAVQNAETLDTSKNKSRKNATRKPKATRDELYEALPIKPIHCDVPEAARFCPDCNAPMNRLGYTFVREELRVIPAKVYRVQYFQEKLVCPACHEEDDTTITSAKTPTPLFSHSPASPDMVALVMYNKGALYLPFYRQEMDWKLKGVPLSRETQARWFIQGALQYLNPIYERLHEELLHREVIHADEVPCQVLHEKDKPATSKSYMWIYLSGTDGKTSITLYNYQPGRSGDFPIEFLQGFRGMIHCDGYSAYGRIEDVILVCCLAHCRRKFFEAIPKERRKLLKLLDINSEQAMKEPAEGTADDETMLPAEKGVAFCNRLFFKERLFKTLTAEKRKKKRLEEEIPVWTEFWSWIETVTPTGGSKLEKAVNYALNHRESLMNYLLDGRCEISNNAAERKAKAYATGRKNFLFHDSVDGAKATAIVMSLIETARANNLNAFKYLYTLLLYMPDYKNEPAGIEQLMPWSTFVQEKCSGIIDSDLELPENRGNLSI
jgi:transposase